MRLRDDQRGQAIQVGAVLLFAVLIIAFSTYQAVIIPADNRRVEFNHNQEVQEHLAELRTAVLGTAKSNSVRSVTVALGTTYPSRTLGLNPNSPGGSLRTVGTTDPMVNLTVDNAVAATDDETADFWDGSARSYNTGLLRYSPIYNRFDEAPTTRYEHSVLYNRFPNTNALVLANQTLLDGDRLSIVTVNGSLARTSSRSTTVDVRPISSSDETVLVEAAGSDPIVLNYSSELSVERWRTILSDQPNVTVEQGSFSPPGDLTPIEVRLDPNRTYRLGMTKAAVGQGVTGEGPAYLTDVEGDGATVQRGSTHQLVLTVRDRYNNPVAGVDVNGSVSGSNSGSLDATRKTTDSDGRVSFTYSTRSETTTGSHAVNFTTQDAAVLSGAGFDAGTPENVTMVVEVTEGGGTGSSAYDLNWTDPSGEPSNSDESFEYCDTDTCEWDVGASSDGELDLNATLSPAFEGILIEFAVGNSTVGTVSPGSETTDSAGAALTTLTALENGTVEVLASANDGSDVIEIHAQNVTGASLRPQPTFDDIVDQSSDCERNAAGYCQGGTAPQVEFDVDWTVTDPSDDLTGVTLELVDPGGTVVDSAQYSYGGESSASGTDTVTDDSGQWDGDYTIRLTGTDDAGNTATVTHTESADGTDDF